MENADTRHKENQAQAVPMSWEALHVVNAQAAEATVQRPIAECGSLFV
jgi:hypothetical protein